MPRSKQKEPDDFFSRVYEVTRLIPYGKITSYGAIARYLGSGRSARMVGWALNACHTSQDFIPAHRVVTFRPSVSLTKEMNSIQAEQHKKGLLPKGK